MRHRKIIAVILLLVGLLMFVAGVASWLLGLLLPINSTVMIICGIALSAAGLIIFITDLFEAWLSRGQSALVDGLQAG